MAATTSTTAAPQTVIQSKAGNGDQTLPPFTVKGPWTLKYTYNCASFGQAGTFSVNITNGDGSANLEDNGPDTTGTSGSDSTYEPQGGTLSLSTLSECDWTITVTGTA